MDTLLEANKHASLMRRRDQFRQFPASRLQCNSAISPRAFGAAAPVSARPALRHLPTPTALASAKINSGEGRFIPPHAIGGLRGRFGTRPRPAGRMGFASSRRPAPVPTRGRRMPVSLAGAGTLRIQFHLDIGEGKRHSISLLPKGAPRTSVSDRAFHALNLEPLGSLSGRRARRLEIAAKVGNAFRVSGSKGFRLPAMRLRKASLPDLAPHGMTWPGTVSLPGAAYIGQAIEPYSTERDFRIAEARLPVSKKLSRAAGLQMARAIPLPFGKAHDNRLDIRESRWIKPASEGQVFRNSGLRAERVSVGPGSVALKQLPAGGAKEKREERVLFLPQEQAWINVSYSWNASK